MTWRARGIAAGVALALVALAYLAGRRSAPAKVVTRDVVRTEVQTRDVVHTQVVHDVQTVHDVQVQTRTVTVTRWAKAPDGTVTVTQEARQDEQEDRHATKAAETKEQAARETDAHQVAQETRTVTVTAGRPQWSVTALAGASLGSPPRLIPGLPGPLVAGVVLERRILGPVSAGLWATSSGAGGVSVRLEW